MNQDLILNKGGVLAIGLNTTLNIKNSIKLCNFLT